MASFNDRIGPEDCTGVKTDLEKRLSDQYRETAGHNYTANKRRGATLVWAT